MRLFFAPTAALLLLGTLGPLHAQSGGDLATPSVMRKPLEAGEADLILGGYPVLRLRGAAGGLSPDQRVAAITDRLTPLLGSPNILPDDVQIFLPDPKSRVNRYPVIYVLGRKIVTVDPATAKTIPGGPKTPLQVANDWSARLQQVLPRVNYRPSNMPEPTIPANPPLTITSDFARIGKQAAYATLRGKIVLAVRGPQPGSLTAAERADLITSRLARLANSPAATAPDAIQVTLDPATNDAALSLAGTTILTVTPADSKAAGFASPEALAKGWAKNLLAVLPTVPALVETTPPPTDTTIPAPPADTAPVPPADATPAPALPRPAVPENPVPAPTPPTPPVPAPPAPNAAPVPAVPPPAVPENPVPPAAAPPPAMPPDPMPAPMP